jgi:hypothetical protein
MNTKIRKFIFFFFLSLFFVSAPLVVLYTAGYRYHWKKGRFEKTGTLLIASQPADATAIMNGDTSGKRTPASFSKILPDDYPVRVEKNGYFTWRKTLTVKSGETTFAKNIVLFKDTLPTTAFLGDIIAVAFTENVSVHLSLTDDWMEIIAAHNDNKTQRLLSRFAKEKYEQETLRISPDNEHVLFTALEKNTEPSKKPAAAAPVLAGIIYPLESDTEPIELRRLFPEGMNGATWNDDGSRLLVMTPRGLFAVHVSDGTVTPLLYSAHVLDAQSMGSETYILERTKTGIALARIDTETPVPIAQLPSSNYRFASSDGAALFIVDDARQTMEIIDNRTGETIHSVRANRLVWQKKSGNRALLWSDFEMFTYDSENHELHLVTRVGTPMRECAWHPSGAYALYSTATHIIAIELDTRDTQNSQTLVQFSDIAAFSLNESILRFVGAVGNQRGMYEREL